MFGTENTKVQKIIPLSNTPPPTPTSAYVTYEWSHRIVELRQIVKEKRAELRDLEVLFQYAKKLLDANSEIAFLVGEEFCSTNTSQTINAATNHIEQKMIGVKMAELDLIEAHKIHIEKTGKN